MGTAGRQLAESSRAGERPRGSFCRPMSYVMVVQPKDSARPSVAPCMARVPAAAQQCRLGPDRSGRGRPAESVEADSSHRWQKAHLLNSSISLSNSSSSPFSGSSFGRKISSMRIIIWNNGMQDDATADKAFSLSEEVSMLDLVKY